MATPSPDASSWPIIAATNTTMMATSACWASPLTRALAMCGPNTAPMAPPPMNPAKLSTPMMKPCR